MVNLTYDTAVVKFLVNFYASLNFPIMFLVRSGVVLVFSLEFDKPRLDAIWLMSCGCNIWYVFISTFYKLNPRKYSVSPSSVISNPVFFMSDTICLIYSSSGPAGI